MTTAKDCFRELKQLPLTVFSQNFLFVVDWDFAVSCNKFESVKYYSVRKWVILNRWYDIRQKKANKEKIFSDKIILQADVWDTLGDVFLVDLLSIYP